MSFSFWRSLPSLRYPCGENAVSAAIETIIVEEESTNPSVLFVRLDRQLCVFLRQVDFAVELEDGRSHIEEVDIVVVGRDDSLG